MKRKSRPNRKIGRPARWGGITTYWLDEGGTKTSSKPKFMLIELNLHKLIGLNIQGPSAGNGADKCSQIRGTLKVA